MNTWIEKLRTIDVDVDGAIERFANKEERYIKYLKLFANNQDFPCLIKAIEEENVDKAFEHCHSLKGVVGNMGFKKLYTGIFEACEILRVGSMDGVREIIYPLRDNYNKILDIINEYL